MDFKNQTINKDMTLRDNNNTPPNNIITFCAIKMSSIPPCDSIFKKPTVYLPSQFVEFEINGIIIIQRGILRKSEY